MIINTLVCVLIALDADVMEAYVIMGLVWIGVMILCMIIWVTGSAFSNISKLNKRMAQLEQKLDNLLLAQVAGYRTANVPTVNTEATAANTIPAQSAEETVPGQAAPASEMPAAEPAAAPTAANIPVNANIPGAANVPAENKPNKKKWILPAVIVGLLLIVVLVVVGILKGKSDSQVINPNQNSGNTSSKNEQSENKEEAAEIEATPVALGSTIDNEYFTMTLDSVELVDDYSFRLSENSTYSLFVEEGYKLLMLKGLFINNHTSAITESSFSLSAIVNETYVAEGYDVRWAFERNNTSEIDPYTEQQYVMYLNIPEKLAENFQTVTFVFGFNDDLSIPVTTWDMDGNRTVEVDQRYSITSGLNASASGETVMAPAEEGHVSAGESSLPISLGETIVTDDYEFTLVDIEMSYEVMPSNPGSVYTSYPAESGKVYIDVVANVKNTMQRDIRIEELFKASALYDGKYPYTGFTIVDDTNRFDWVGSYVAATPLETCLAHSLIECPVEVDNSGKPVVVYLELGDTVYEYSLH